MVYSLNDVKVYEHRTRVCLRLLVEVDPVIEIDVGLHVFSNGINSLGREPDYVIVLEMAVWGRKRRRHGIHRRYEELIEFVVR